MSDRSYIAIDLKSFYASVECVERGLDPLTAKLVVADETRTEKTICLAVTPALKAMGISGRPRLFEVVQRLGRSGDYIVAAPRMALYMEYSRRIYNVYLKYISPQDMHPYSVDEVFIDVTPYLRTYDMTPHELAMTMIRDVLSQTGITATVGIGTNLYLCKIAMDIVAKKMPPDKDGVRIAELDEMSYRKTLWDHTPIRDFWRVGKGYARKLERAGIYTMGDIARCSLGEPGEPYNEDMLYRMFGVNAELLIDHAWGYEPCTIADIKAYKPATKSINSGKVLTHPYTYSKACLVVREMTERLALDMVDKGLETDRISITINYDIENMKEREGGRRYTGEIKEDAYGRKVPKPSSGIKNLDRHTSSTKDILAAAMELFDRVANHDLLIRKIYVTVNHLRQERVTDDGGLKNYGRNRYRMKAKDSSRAEIQQTAQNENNDILACEDKRPVSGRRAEYEQLDMFTDYEQKERHQQEQRLEYEKERRCQKTIVNIMHKFGKNAIIKADSLEEDAVTREMNNQIGGHKA